MSPRSRQHRILRAVIYARVSKDDEGRGRSCKEQIASCLKDCEYEEWTVAEILQDNDRGASRHSKREREDWKKLPSILRKGDVLVVWEPSRITRTMTEFGEFCDLVARIGVLLYYDGRVWDMDDDDDRNRVWQDILDGAKQAGKTRKRVLRSMAANVEDKKPHGKTPPGYVIERDSRTGKAIGRKPVPEQAKLLQEAAARALARESLRSISRDLARKWVEAGGVGAFSPADVKRFLINPTIYGLRHHKGEIVGKASTWDPILDPEDMPELVKILTAPDRLTHRGSEPVWLLTHIARCGVCVELGEPGIIAQKLGAKRPGKRGPRQYLCTKYGHVARHLEMVDDYVEGLLFYLMSLPEVAAKLKAPLDLGGRSVDEELAEIEELRARRKAYMRDAARAGMSADATAEYVGAIEELIAEAQARVTAMTRVENPLLAELAGPNPEVRWAKYSMERRRETIRLAFEVTIHKLERRGRRGPDADLGVTVRPIGSLARASAVES